MNLAKSLALNLAGKRVVVMGLGHFGGGAGVTRFCLNQGATVLLTDQTSPDKLTAGLALINDLVSHPALTLRLGEHRTEDFRDAQLIVVNPAVKPDNPFVAAAIANGVAVTSEIRLLAQHLPDRAKTIAITGSAGKSTTTAMTGHAMVATLGSDRVHLGGNLGGSLLGKLDQIKPDDWVILELSSFMLQGLRDDKWSPHIAVATNFTHNHLDWHSTPDHYLAAKQAIFDHQQPGDIAILGPGCDKFFKPVITDVRLTPDASLWQGELLVPGHHNRTNAQMAATIVHAAIGQSPAVTAEALYSFPGLPHRLQFICEHADVRFYNDSKATTPQAALMAINSFGPHTVHAILGGYDKQSDLTEMAKHAASHCASIYTIGDTGNAIASAARQKLDANNATSSDLKVHECGTLENAVKQAVAHVYRGDVVLLSPGCASWDQFENYEQRGQLFAQYVIQNTGEGSPNPRVRM